MLHISYSLLICLSQTKVDLYSIFGTSFSLLAATGSPVLSKALTHR